MMTADLLILTHSRFSSLAKTVLFNIKEAHNHSFSSKVGSVFSLHRPLTRLDRLQTGDGMTLMKYGLFWSHNFSAGPSLLDEIMSIIILLQSRNRMRS